MKTVNTPLLDTYIKDNSMLQRFIHCSNFRGKGSNRYCKYSHNTLDYIQLTLGFQI